MYVQADIKQALGVRRLLCFEPEKHKQDGYGKRLSYGRREDSLCTEYHIAVTVGDVKESMQQVIQNITAVRIKILVYMVKQWEALGWIIHQRQALSGVLRGKGRQD